MAAVVKQHDVAIREQAELVAKLEANSPAQDRAIAELRREVEELKGTQKATDDTKGTLYLAADKNPRMIKTEMSAKQLIAELKRKHPRTSWRLLKSGVICSGYQQIVTESSSDARMEYNTRAMDEQGITREMIKECWEAVAETISVRWSP